MLRMGNHYISDNILRTFFIGGLYPFEMKIYMRECIPVTREDAFALAKAWEESIVHIY